MLRAEGPVFAFRHEIARQAVEASLTPMRRKTLNERLLAQLQAVTAIPFASLRRKRATGILAASGLPWCRRSQLFKPDPILFLAHQTSFLASSNQTHEEIAIVANAQLPYESFDSTPE